VQQRLGTTRTIVVQPTAYGTDNHCTLEAIAALGPGARGVAVADTSVTEGELDQLHRAGIRGARFQMLPGDFLPWEALETIACRIAAFGWHIQLQMDGRLLKEREAVLQRRPCPVVIDHVGKFLEPVPVEHPGFRSLLRLIGAADAGSNSQAHTKFRSAVRRSTPMSARSPPQPSKRCRSA
jgi:D-galactarolactone isomerase